MPEVDARLKKGFHGQVFPYWGSWRGGGNGFWRRGRDRGRIGNYGRGWG